MAGVMPPEYQELLSRMQAEQRAYQQLVLQQQQLETQLNENAMVKEELDDNVSAVYKLHGKVLVAVDAADARGTVNSRLDFIKNELEKVEKSARAQQAKMAAVQKEMVEAQKKIAAR